MPSWITHKFTGAVDRKLGPVGRHSPDTPTARPPNTQDAPRHRGLELEMGGGTGTSGTPALRTAGLRYTEAPTGGPCSPASRRQAAVDRPHSAGGGRLAPAAAPTSAIVDHTGSHRGSDIAASWITHKSQPGTGARTALEGRNRAKGRGFGPRPRAQFDVGAAISGHRGSHINPQGRWIGNPAPAAQIFPVYRLPASRSGSNWRSWSAHQEDPAMASPVSNTPAPGRFGASASEGSVAQLDTIARTSGRVISKASSRVRPGMRSSRS